MKKTHGAIHASFMTVRSRAPKAAKLSRKAGSHSEPPTPSPEEPGTAPVATSKANLPEGGPRFKNHVHKSVLGLDLDNDRLEARAPLELRPYVVGDVLGKTHSDLVGNL